MHGFLTTAEILSDKIAKQEFVFSDFDAIVSLAAVEEFTANAGGKRLLTRCPINPVSQRVALNGNVTCRQTLSILPTNTHREAIRKLFRFIIVAIATTLALIRGL